MLNQNVVLGKKIDFLGHIVSADDIKVDPKKSIVIIEWSTPKSITSLRGFLGLTGYYRIFFHNYTQIVSPLTSLLKRDSFKWDKDTENYFEQLKTLMTSKPVLAAPDFTKTFIYELML